MMGDRLPSLLLSLILHLAVAALVLFWPAPRATLSDITPGTLVSGLVTLGKAGKAVPDSRQETPKSRKGEGQAEPQKADPAPDPKPQDQPRPQVTPEPKPEVKPEALPDPDAAQIPKDPEKKPEEKKPEPKPEPKPEEKKPEEKKPEVKPEPKPKPEEKKPEEKKPEPKPKKEDDLASALADLGKQVGGDSRGGRTGQAAPGRGKGNALSSGLDDLAKQIGGGGDDASGRGPGGSGGDGLGVRGGYLDSIHSRVKNNWSWPGRADRLKFTTRIRISIAPNGSITSWQVISSSGNDGYDNSVIQALLQTRNLEPPPEPQYREVEIGFTFF